MTRLSEAAPAPPYVRDLRDLVARALCAPLLVAIAATLAVGRSHAEDTAQLVAVGSDSGISLQHRYGSPQKGYITEFGGSGGAWIDYDMDGWLDLFLVNGLDGPVDNPVAATIAALRQPPGDVGHRLFRSHRGSFVAVPEGGGAGDHQAWGNGAATADVDSDGYPELFVSAIGTDRLYRNNGDGSFDPGGSALKTKAGGRVPLSPIGTAMVRSTSTSLGTSISILSIPRPWGTAFVPTAARRSSAGPKGWPGRLICCTSTVSSTRAPRKAS